MKITKEDYKEVSICINRLLDSSTGAVVHYENGQFPRSEKTKDLQKRFCFDLFNTAVYSELVSKLYTYLNDDHIYTALKKICPKVVRKF